MNCAWARFHLSICAVLGVSCGYTKAGHALVDLLSTGLLINQGFRFLRGTERLHRAVWRSIKMQEQVFVLRQLVMYSKKLCIKLVTLRVT